MSQYLDKDGASRIAENFLSKQAEQDAILANLQFDLKEAEHALVKTIQGPAPLNIRALTRPLDDYLISGNTVQDGTPTPEAPVDVVGCGVKTENLLPPKNTTTYKGITFAAQLDGTTICNGTAEDELIFGWSVPASISGDYYFSGCPDGGSNQTYDVFCYDKTAAARPKQWDGTSASISDFGTTKNNEVQIVSGHDTEVRIRFRNGYHAENLIFKMMLRKPSAPSDFEPYGYKLPPTINGAEYPIYLGSCQSTRRIKKRVLTGDESWTKSDVAFYMFISNAMTYGLRLTTLFCSHYQCIDDGRSYNDTPNNSVYSGGSAGNGYSIYFKTDTYSNVDAWKQFLASQYAAGTPVTVWYVLATPEITTINEPLHKIGDYADTISMTQAGVEISTTKGFNTITTDTTVLPSNIEVKGVINNA